LAGRKQDAILTQYGEGHMLLAGKVAVITGGGRGIGRAIARKFAGEGAAAVVAARTQSEIEAVAKEIRDAGGRAAAVPTDVAEQEHCEHLIQTCEAQFGRIDILVNNAGDYGPVKPVEEINPPEWDRVIAEHLRGAYLLTRLVLPGMYARGSGTILNISSLSAKSVVAAEAARKGVRVNAICPGPVTETKMSKDLGEALAKRMGVTPGEQLAGFLKTVLQGRGQTTDEIAAAALFLCSEHASAITGQALNVDGGTAFY
jgi:NAD(P)-dependent dehydrogenase (short-subunit alcohol dehydrogenase family)